MARLEFTMEELQDACATLEEATAKLDLPPDSTLLWKLSVVYVKLLKAMRDQLAADKRAFDQEYGGIR